MEHNLNRDYCVSCKQIDEEENIEHLLRFCPAHNYKRLQTLGRYTLPKLAAIQGVSIPKLLFPKKKLVREIQ